MSSSEGGSLGDPPSPYPYNSPMSLVPISPVPMSPVPMSPVPFSPPPISIGLRGISPSDEASITEQLENFLSNHYGIDFEYDTELISNTYHSIEPYTHIFKFNHRGSLYIIKFASESTIQYKTNDIFMKPFIQKEWEVYQQIQNLPDYETHKQYFLEDVKGGEYNSCAYLILPYIKSETLEGFVNRTLEANTQVAKQSCKYLQDAASALEYLISHGICHGDMHSGNILITDKGTKIIDFDSAGECDQVMDLGYAHINGRKTLRRNVNFIGHKGNTFTGFFIMCKDIFSKFNYLKPFIIRINRIIQEYKNSEDVFLAYKKIISLLKTIQGQEGGRRTRRKSIHLRRSRRRRSRIPSSK